MDHTTTQELIELIDDYEELVEELSEILDKDDLSPTEKLHQIAGLLSDFDEHHIEDEDHDDD
jgi:hypothetical protein